MRLVRKSDPVCTERNATEDSAEFSFFPRDGNSAHVWMIDKLMEAGQIRTGSQWMDSISHLVGFPKTA